MKKVKEIDVWVNPTSTLNADRNCVLARFDVYNYHRAKGYKKAKLIIELPERKRTFTESEIREVHANMPDVYDTDIFINSLFGKGEENE